MLKAVWQPWKLGKCGSHAWSGIQVTRGTPLSFCTDRLDWGRQLDGPKGGKELTLGWDGRPSADAGMPPLGDQLVDWRKQAGKTWGSPLGRKLTR